MDMGPETLHHIYAVMDSTPEIAWLKGNARKRFRNKTTMLENGTTRQRAIVSMQNVSLSYRHVEISDLM